MLDISREKLFWASKLLSSSNLSVKTRPYAAIFIELSFLLYVYHSATTFYYGYYVFQFKIVKIKTEDYEIPTYNFLFFTYINFYYTFHSLKSNL